MPRFAANLTMMFNEVPFADRFDAAARAGFESVEFLFPYALPPEAVAERVRRNGLTVALFNMPPGDWDAGDRGFAALPARREEVAPALATALRYADATGAGRVHLMAGLADPADAACVAAYRDAVRFCAEALGERGIDLVLEPINGRNMPGYFLNSFERAAELIDGLAPAQPQAAVRHLPLPDHPRRRRHGAAPDDADDRPCPGRQRAVAQRAGRRGAELPLPVRRARPARLPGLRRLRVQSPGTHRGRARLVRALPDDGGRTVSLRLGCIADDYTGASDLANTLRRNGLRTVQTIGVPDPGLAAAGGRCRRGVAQEPLDRGRARGGVVAGG